MKEANFEQRQVIHELDNNAILFASAGTGKTFTVAARVANILSQELAAPENILCLTFTIKACKEMQEDITSQIGDQANGVNIYTIHGFCYKLLMEEYRRTGVFYGELGVCDEVDQEEILRGILISRFYRWQAEETLQEEGIPLPDWENTPVCQIGEELFWRVEDRLVSRKGEVFLCPKDIGTTALLCPHCGAACQIVEGVCNQCKEELVFRFAPKTFEILRRKTALRNFISELKHIRQAQGFYSENEGKDYIRSLFYLKEEKPNTYEGLTSHYAQFLGYAPDEDFEKAMQRFVGRLAVEYEEKLRLSNLLDFDDLILKANAVMDSEEGREYWSKRYSYIILDEMQDTSALEYTFLKKIFAQNRILLCGDFFQTIYGWRGSRPEMILQDYIESFSAKIYQFSENYRATKTLSEATFGYLQNTYPEIAGKYIPKNLQIHSEEKGDKIFCYAFDNREQEAWQIYKYVSKHKPTTPTDICILARSNKYIAELAKYFTQFEEEKKEGLRFFTVEENFQFFKKPVVKDILALLKLLIQPTDRVSMERIAEKYVKQVGTKHIQSFRERKQTGVSILSFLDAQTYLYGDPYHALIEGYGKENIVVYDTETTGLDLEKDEIVQISAIKIGKEGKIVDSLDIFVEPTVEISQAAYQTHGFDIEYIRAHGGGDTQTALRQFSEFAENCVLVGHNNLAYDNPLLARQFFENGLPFPRILAEYDTLLLAKQFYAELENFKLDTLCSHFSIVNACAHNALGDITATAACLARMIEEKILPTALERIAFLTKHRGKFEKFYEFYKELQSRLDNGEEIGEYIVKKLFLRKKYPAQTDAFAIRDIVESLQTEEENRRAFLKSYLTDAALAGSQMDTLIAKLKRIPIITVHQAKGCEFDTVILAGADDSNFPSYAAKQSGGEDEEKKVFYVAITRAKNRLIMTRALRDKNYERKETPYFWKIPEKYIHANRAWKNGE